MSLDLDLDILDLDLDIGQNIIIDGLQFRCTSFACPEQYDVYDGRGRKTGYVRLRWGALRVDYPNHRGSVVLSHVFPDTCLGQFTSSQEREHWLQQAADAINKERKGR